MSDIVNLLRRKEGMTVSQLVDELQVTGTAVRQRLHRLIGEGLVERQLVRKGVGRPSHRYFLTTKGRRAGGTNFAELAFVLWDELRASESSQGRRGLLPRIANRLSRRLSEQVAGVSGTTERMRAIARWFTRHGGVPFEVTDDGGLPVLSAQACPYPELAESDRGVCSVEKMMLSELVGRPVRLAECRLDGGQCCSFVVSGEGTDQ